MSEPFVFGVLVLVSMVIGARLLPHKSEEDDGDNTEDGLPVAPPPRPCGARPTPKKRPKRKKKRRGK